jgi:diacylglycerol kinase (ATP)
VTDATPSAAASAGGENTLSNKSGVVIAANPYSGFGPTRRRVAELTALLREHRLRPSVIWDRAERAAVLRDPQLPLECRCVVAAGGDGTVADVINEMPTSVPFATLPSGNENLFAREFGFPRDGRSLARAIIAGRSQRIDLGRAGDRLFSLMLSVGFDAAVVHQVVAWRANGQALRRVNRLSYAKPIVDVLRNYDYQSIQLEADGHCVTGTHAFVFNLPQYGFQFPFAPDARGDDGWFDWLVFGRPGILAMLDYAYAVLRAKHRGRPDVAHGRARTIRIRASRQVPVQLDGEAAGFTPIAADIVPSALQVLRVPQGELQGWPTIQSA